MIYFDNAATTYPKPLQVKKALEQSLSKYAVNPGRSAYPEAVKTAQMVYETRAAAADFFGCDDPSKVIFCANCTAALNTVINGLAVKGSHFVISSLEHNAVVRPLETRKQAGICDYSIAQVAADDNETVENFSNLIRENTVAVICTGASNVFGKRLPVREIGKTAHEKSVLFVLDAAQTAGVTDINMKDDNIDYLCVAAHKGLYAPMSLGLLVIGCDRRLEPLIQGGTGNYSSVFVQPDEAPERFEAGTLSVPLICSLKAGIDFVKGKSVEKIFRHEYFIVRTVFSYLENMENIELYTDLNSMKEHFIPLLSFNVRNVPSETVAELLARDSIAVRAGFHCAYLAHKSYKTERFGTVRIAPGIFNTKNDVNLLLNSIFKIAKRKNV